MNSTIFTYCNPMTLVYKAAIMSWTSFIKALYSSLSLLSNSVVYSISVKFKTIRYATEIKTFKQTLENTDWAIKNGQSRETGNIGYKDIGKQTKTQHNMC